jgi:CIC family chloride channel protein
LIVGALSIFYPQVWGNGYSVVGDILQGQLLGVALIAVLCAKVLATSATVGSGAVGGIFTPTLFIGCALGGLVGQGLHILFPSFTSESSAYALVGMGGFLSATTHAPLTSILMLFEMTLDYDIVLPLMLACVTAHYVAKVYRRGESVYFHALNSRGAGSEAADWQLRTVESLVQPTAATVSPSTTLNELFARLPKGSLNRVYVMVDGQIVAWLDSREVFSQVQSGTLDGSMTAGAVARPVTFTLTPDMSLGTALDGFLREQAMVLPVTASQWRNTLLGEVSRHDVLLAIQDRMSFPK